MTSQQGNGGHARSGVVAFLRRDRLFLGDFCVIDLVWLLIQPNETDSVDQLFGNADNGSGRRHAAKQLAVAFRKFGVFSNCGPRGFNDEMFEVGILTLRETTNA